MRALGRGHFATHSLLVYSSQRVCESCTIPFMCRVDHARSVVRILFRGSGCSDRRRHVALPTYLDGVGVADATQIEGGINSSPAHTLSTNLA